MPRLTAGLLAAAVIAVSACATQAVASEATGIWAMSNGKVTVKVTDCGNKLCAAIVALKQPISKIDGKPKVDRENPDPDLRRRPLIGLSILIGMKSKAKANGLAPFTTPMTAEPTAPPSSSMVTA